MNRRTPDPSREGNCRGVLDRLLPSWEGLGAGSSPVSRSEGNKKLSMRSFRVFDCLLSLILFGAGCDNPAPSMATPPAATNRLAGAPQPKLPTVKLWLGAQEMVAEVARTIPQLQTGMMFRESMEENEGMLFLMPFPQRASFYMKNTLIPLSCAYIDSEGEILEIHDMTPKEEAPILAASDRILFVLETNKGWFERNKIGVGTVIRTERGSLEETFLGRH